MRGLLLAAVTVLAACGRPEAGPTCTLAEPPWATVKAAACVEANPLGDQLYADCTPGTDLDMAECQAPPVGTLVCQGNVLSGRGRLTVSCQSSTECPAGMVCTVGDGFEDDLTGTASSGSCEKACTPGSGQAECYRCDLVCSPSGVCVPGAPPGPPGLPCTVDCQCEAGETCRRGSCEPSTAPRLAVCGGDGTCLCEGGTCEDGCCYLPDGSIAAQNSAACEP